MRWSGLVVSRLLYERYPDEDEGFLTARRAALVNRDALAALALQLGMDRFLLLGRGEAEAGGAMRPSLLAGTFEAVAGAVFLGEGLETTRDLAAAAVRRAPRPARRRRRATEIGEEPAPGVEPATSPHAPALPARRSSGPPHDQTFTVAAVLAGEQLALGEGIEPPARRGARRRGRARDPG